MIISDSRVLMINIIQHGRKLWERRESEQEQSLGGAGVVIIVYIEWIGKTF